MEDKVSICLITFIIVRLYIAITELQRDVKLIQSSHSMLTAIIAIPHSVFPYAGYSYPYPILSQYIHTPS